jgi:hypothetical protein
MLAPLFCGKVGTWAKMLVARTVVNARCGDPWAQLTSLDASGLVDEEASVEFVAVNAAQRFGGGVDDVGALVAGGSCCGTLVRRHDS